MNDEKLSIIKEKLSFFPFLAEIEENRIEQLCENTDIIHIEANNVMFRKGEPCHKGLYLLYDGKILVENPETDISYEVNAGDIVGITAFIGWKRYAVTATIIEDAELIFLPDI